MNDRQRILSLLKGNAPDRVPWLGDLSYWVGAMESRGEVPRGFGSSPAYYDLHRQLGVGFYLQGYFPFTEKQDETVRIETSRVPGKRIRVIHTPAGSIREAWTSLPESFTEAPTEHLVKSPDDLKVIRYMYEHTTYTPDYDEAKRREALVHDLGVVLCYSPKTPLMQLVVKEAGIENLTACYVEAQDELEATLAVMEAKCSEAMEIAAACPADCVMIPENLSSEVVGKVFFNAYMRTCHEKWTARIHECGKSSFIHIDGTLRGLLPELGRAGFTVLEALTPSPVGDVAMSDMRALTGPGPILWGGIPGSYFTPAVTDGEFDRYVRDVLEVMRREPRYVLGVADQVPSDGLRRRVARVVELTTEFGRYGT